MAITSCRCSFEWGGVCLLYTSVGDTFSTDDEYKVKQDNEDDPVKFHLDREKKEITFTVHKDLKWSDGSEVTAKDIVATYELMGNPKFKENARYTLSLIHI